MSSTLELIWGQLSEGFSTGAVMRKVGFIFALKKVRVL